MADEGYTVLDLFAGAGGLTEGFLRGGYDIIGHVEMDPHAFRTLEIRIAYHILKKEDDLDIYRDYIYGEIRFEDFLNSVRYHLKDIGMINEKIDEDTQEMITLKIMEKTKHKNVDVIIGGPPCQTFSLISRYRRNPAKFYDDERTHLFRRYVHFLKKFSPRIFVFENVAAMRNAGNGKIFMKFREMVENLGYMVYHRIMNAYDYGVLQNRKRMIVIGIKGGYDGRTPFPSPVKTHRDYVVWDLLRDLPSLAPGEGQDGPMEYVAPPTGYLLKHKIRDSTDILTRHRARNHNERDREIYRIAIRLWNSEHRRLKYYELPEHLKTHKNERNFVDRYKVVAGDLPFSHTVTAHLSKDGHYYIHPDIEQARSLTVREAARLQSFPDSYIFEGPLSSQFRQVGNAVPPLMAEAIAKRLIDVLED